MGGFDHVAINVTGKAAAKDPNEVFPFWTVLYGSVRVHGEPVPERHPQPSHRFVWLLRRRRTSGSVLVLDVFPDIIGSSHKLEMWRHRASGGEGPRRHLIQMISSRERPSIFDGDPCSAGALLLIPGSEDGGFTRCPLEQPGEATARCQLTRQRTDVSS